LAGEEHAVKLITALVALAALSQTAVAQTPDCKSISEPGARLGCYDRINPAAASSATAKPAPRVAPSRKFDAGISSDSMSAEDARVNAQLKNICRGC
jgi:hypothetical protein